MHPGDAAAPAFSVGARQDAGPTPDDAALAGELCASRTRIVAELHKRIIGQGDIIDHLLVALFAGGHALFVGVPGLAKTLLVQTLAQVLSLTYSRIQFTPDLMPPDILGTEILDQGADGQRRFRFVKGPVFCNLLLADEINRTPPKTQAALLQAMQEGQITQAGTTHPLPPPFHVLATQNPIEQEGTYPLPEAQLDRFMMLLRVDYPTAADELAIVRQTGHAAPETIHRQLGPIDLMRMQQLVSRVPVAEPTLAQAVALVRATRPGDISAPAAVRDYVLFGAGPRAAQHLIVAAKARALLHGRFVVDTSDIASLARPVLRHRVLLNFAGEAAKVGCDDLVDAALATVPGMSRVATSV